MPVYEYGCPCGRTFSVFVHRPGAPEAVCPACGRPARRRLSRFAASRGVSPGPGPQDAPTTWEDTGGGDPEIIAHWQRALERRAKLEERYPELATPRRPVLAHEGPYESRPLVAGEGPAEDGSSGSHGSHHHGPGQGAAPPGAR